MSPHDSARRREFQFEVEYVWRGDVTVVLARQITPGNFSLDAESTLDGCGIKPVVSAPRAIDAEGKPRGDVFAFTLSNRNDATHFAKGSLLILAAADLPTKDSTS